LTKADISQDESGLAMDILFKPRRVEAAEQMEEKKDISQSKNQRESKTSSVTCM